MRGGSDGRKILHFHGNGAGTFAPDEARIFAEEGSDFWTDRWLIERDFDAEAFEDFHGKFSIGVVDAFGNEDVIACFQKSEIDEGDCCLTTGSNESAVAAFEFADTRGEFERGGRAVEAVSVADGVLVPSVLDGGGVWKKHSGAAISSGGKRLESLGGVRVGMDQLCFPRFRHAESVAQRKVEDGKLKRENGEEKSDEL